MGSPAFALPTLHALLDTSHDVVLVVSQPDRPAGRSRRHLPPAVARFAQQAHLPLYQPHRLRQPSDQAPLSRAAPDLIIVAAYGLLLPSNVLNLPPLGCLNVHPSFLPRY